LTLSTSLSPYKIMIVIELARNRNMMEMVLL